MEFNMNKNLFLKGIQKTLGIVEKKTTMPILSNLLIRTQQSRIRIVAADREIGLVADYEADIIREGDITLSAKKLYEMVREIQGDMIHVSKTDKDVVVLTCKKEVYRIPGIPAADYPTVEDQEGLSMHKIKGALLGEMIRKTVFAISADEMRKNLTGVFFEAERVDGTSMVRMVATDGHRLSVIKADAGEGDDDFLTMDKGVIIPRKGLSEIRRLVEEQSGDVYIGINKGACTLKTDHSLLRVSLIDGEYPDYKRVIPSERGLVVGVGKGAFLHALRRMSVISSERYSGVIITLSNDRMVLNSTNPDVGEANDEIEVSYQGDERSVGYNVTYLIDAIDVIDEEWVEFEIGMAMKPAVIRAVGNENYFCIVMPLKL
jgi:DNA polymerase III subunit beta